MLYQEIRRKCECYHKSTKPNRYDQYYRDYMIKDKDWTKWDGPGTLDLAEAGKLLGFLNLWKTPMKVRLIDLLSRLKFALMCTKELHGKGILDIDFNEDVSTMIELSFKILATCEHSYESTAASKILHTINPDLFVMWDDKIRSMYGREILNKRTGLKSENDYAHHFLPEMKRLATESITQVTDKRKCSRTDAIKWLAPCSNTLAKVLDEYNYVKSRK